MYLPNALRVYYRSTVMQKETILTTGTYIVNNIQLTKEHSKRSEKQDWNIELI